MAEVITQFKLETTQFDSKLRDAAQGLKSVVNVANNAGKSFTGFSQNAIAAARSLGQIESGANNAKDRVKDLVGSFNDAAKAYNKLTEEQRNSDFGKALSASLQQLQGRIRDAKEELYSLGDAVDSVKSKSSGLFGGDGLTGMLQVAGGNLIAKGVTMFASEIADTVKQSVQLAREAEGIKMAFDKLDDPTLLDALKEATHGTVSELELMKAAVKFDDFKLPVEQLGTLLAFAQKKAKDTGQSVDYMVDSIVTGLGRKSLMILDNLGLSAAQIKEEMAKTGDMTSAVANIIRDQMAKAGDYVETAADRAARAAADAQNQMIDLGREAMPVAEQWEQGFNAIKLAGMDLLTNVFGPLMRSAAQIQNILNGGAGPKLKPGIPNLADGPAPSPTRQPGKDHVVKAPGGYVEVTDKNTGKVIGGKHFDNLDDKNLIKDWQKTLFKTPKTSHTETPQEKAQKRMSDAQHKYAVALEIAQAEFDKGNITEKDLKTAQKRAAESLFEAADDAYRTYADPQYKTVREDAKQKFVNLGGEVKTLTEIEKANQKTAREQEQAQKKLSDAQKKRADALESGDLRGYLSAGKELRKLGGASVMEDLDRQDAEIPLNFTFTESNLNAFIESLKERLSNAGVGTELASGLSAQLGDATALSTMLSTANKAGLDPSMFGLGDIFKKIFNMTPGDYVSDGEMKNTSKRVRKEAQKRGKSDDQKDTTFVEAFGKLNNGVTSMVGSLEQMGIQIPEGFKGVLSGISGAIGVLQAIMVIVEAIEAMQTVGTFLGIFAKGGIVPHAAKGYYVPGNRPSGDTTLIRANAGELILNRAAQGNLASQLEGGAGLGDLNLSAVIRGEQIRLVLNNNGRRTGRGEYVQSTKR